MLSSSKKGVAPQGSQLQVDTCTTEMYKGKSWKGKALTNGLI